MDPIIVPTQAVCVWPHQINVIRDLCRRYVFYYEIDGASYEVLGFGTTDTLIVFGTPTPAIDGNRAIEMVAYDFKDGEKFRIYGIEATPAAAGELASVEVWG